MSLGDDDLWLLCARRCKDADRFGYVGIDLMFILAKVFDELVARWILCAAGLAGELFRRTCERLNDIRESGLARISERS